MTTMYGPATVVGDRAGDALGGDAKSIMPDRVDEGVLARQLTRRREAGWRSVPLACGCCRDPWLHREPERLDDATLDSWVVAALHFRDLGMRALLPREVEDALRRRELRRRWLAAAS